MYLSNRWAIKMPLIYLIIAKELNIIFMAHLVL